ncbi:MAG: hypothetical protein QXM27_03010 [Candidatus Pacearchaeota archaeon]
MEIKEVISEEALNEFKEIYKKKFKKELDDREALAKAIKLLNLYKAIYPLSSFTTRKEAKCDEKN